MSATLIADHDRHAAGTLEALVTARDIMRKPVVMVSRYASLSEAARILIGNGISGAPVVDSRGRVVGVVSLRDLVERFVEEPLVRPPRVSDEDATPELDDEGLEQTYSRAEAPTEEDLVEDVMTSEIRSVLGDASLPEIASEMKRHHVHRVLVEEHGRYVGLIGTFEVLDVLFP